MAFTVTLTEAGVIDDTSLSSCTSSFEADPDFVAMQLTSIDKMAGAGTVAFNDDLTEYTGEFYSYYAASADVIGPYLEFLTNTMPGLVDACGISLVVVSTHVIDTLGDCGFSTTGTFTIDSSTVNGDVPEIACVATTTSEVTDAPATNTTAATNGTATEAPSDSSAGGFSFTMLSALALASLAEF